MGDMSDAQFKAVRHWAAIKSWKTRRRNAAKAAAGQGGGGVTQLSGDYRHDKAEAELATSGVKEVKYLGGGITESYEATLDNGMRGAFKPSEEGGGYRAGIDGLGAEREQAAWEVAKLVGMEDMIAPVVIREMDVPGGATTNDLFDPGVKRGSLATWQEGTVAKDVRSQAERYDGGHDLQRAAMFDYITGNQDRHNGNWVIADDDKIKLIDHNLSLGDNPVGPKNHRKLLREVASEENSLRPPSERSRVHLGVPARGHRELSGRYDDQRLKAPSDYAKPFVKNKAKLLSELAKLGFSDNALLQVARRINYAGSAKSWVDLYNVGG